MDRKNARSRAMLERWKAIKADPNSRKKWKLRVTAENMKIVNPKGFVFNERDLRQAIMRFAKRLRFKPNKYTKTVSQDEGVAQIVIAGKPWPLHQVLMYYWYGITRKGYEIYFKDGNHKNLRKSNLGYIKKREHFYNTPKGSRHSPETEFKPGNVPAGFKGFGHRNVYREHGSEIGRAYATVDRIVGVQFPRGKKAKRRLRTTYARFRFGIDKIPDGYVVYHKDRNPLNDARDNLELISRAELLKRNRKRRRG
ncbi:MAG TPA: HNH endonuclease [Candidatus Kryptobacter bacterium]|nr:HNH endonuclease [Candidatus Kryptobacter bacterium]